MVSITSIKSKSKREFGALAVAIAVLAVLFSPYPGIDAVTISLTDNEIFVDFTNGVLADIDDILSIELSISDPATNDGLTLPPTPATLTSLVGTSANISSATDFAVDQSGDYVIADNGNGKLIGLSANGTESDIADIPNIIAVANQPGGTGNLVVATSDGVISQVSPDGTVTELEDTATGITDMIVDGAGNYVTVNSNTNTPQGNAFDVVESATGSYVYVSNAGTGGTLYQVDAGDTVTVIATGITNDNADPLAVKIASNGDYVVAGGSSITRVTPSGDVTVVIDDVGFVIHDLFVGSSNNNRITVMGSAGQLSLVLPGSAFNPEISPDDLSVLRVILNPGDSDEVVAFFDLFGNRLSNALAANFGQTADVEGKIVALNFNGITSTLSSGLGTGPSGYGYSSSSDPLAQDVKANYDIKVNSGLLKEGDNTIQIDILPSVSSPPDDITTFTSTFTNNITGTAAEINVPVGSDDGGVTFTPSSDLSTLNVISNTLPGTIVASDGQLLDFTTAPTFDDQGGVKSVRVSDSAVNITSDVSSATVSVSYPDGIIVSGSSDDWAGTITVPSVSTAAPPSPDNDVTGLVFSVGDGNTRLTFDQAVRLLLPGQAGQDGAFFSGEDADGLVVSRPLTECSFVPVNQDNANTNLEAGTALESCFTRAGSDMIIWTTHFSSFGSFSASGPASTVLLSTTANPITNLDTISFTATFSGNVTDFELGDITVTGTANGGTPVASNLAGSGTEYTFDVVRGTTDGTVTVSIAAGTVTSGGVGVTASNEVTVEIDTKIPTVSLIHPRYANSNTLTFGVVFAETVFGFNEAEFSLAGVQATNLRGSDRNYQFDIVHSFTDGTFSPSLPSNVAFDAAGNGNGPSSIIQITLDFTPPTPSITTTASTLTNAETVPFKVNFDEDVPSFELDDITVTGTANGGSPAASNLVGSGSVYTFDVARGTTDGTVTVSIDADMLTDLAGNNNVASPSSVTVTIDTDNPGITAVPANGTITNANPVEFTITLTENVVEDLTSGDITVTGTANGGTPAISSFEGSGNTYTFDVARGSTDGTVTVSIAADTITDAAGNTNEAFATTVTIDTTVSNFLPPVPAVPPVITLERPTLTPPTFSLDDHFTDPDGDTLSYTITTEDCGARITQESNGGIFEFLPSISTYMYHLL